MDVAWRRDEAERTLGKTHQDNTIEASRTISAAVVVFEMNAARQEHQSRLLIMKRRCPRTFFQDFSKGMYDPVSIKFELDKRDVPLVLAVLLGALAHVAPRWISGLLNQCKAGLLVGRFKKMWKARRSQKRRL